MNQALVEHLLSFENKFSDRFAATFPLYKFYKIFEKQTHPTSADVDRLLLAKDGDTYYILNSKFVSVLTNRLIWFSPASQFNDPWDAGGAVSLLRSRRKAQAQVIKLIFGEEEAAIVDSLKGEERYKRIEEGLRQAFAILRFTCFTKRRDSNPMWAHYADNHKGACLEFRFVRPWQQASNPTFPTFRMDPAFTGHYEVRYSKKFTKVPDLSNIGSAVRLLHTKHPDWAYEQEVRFIRVGDQAHPGVGGSVKFYKSSLTKVILGCKVPPAVQWKIQVILDSFKYTDTELIKTEFDFATQSLKDYVWVRNPAAHDSSS